MWQDRILFEDGEALVIDKPAGLAMHAGPRTRESLEDYLVHLRLGFQRPPQPVHRLDRDTSGCLLLARNPGSAKRFQQAFEAGAVEKRYLAIVEGVPDASDGRIDMALAKISSKEEGWRMVPDERGKTAATRWRLVAQRDGRSAIAFEPETGRTHQVRVHAASGLGLPIVGDPVYGRRPPRGSGGPMLLHALALRLERGAKPPIDARAPLPPSFAYAGFGDAED
jgi:tRNA pseudouridine32 synthase/23S rRNA pseudouridine746 synthase